MNFDPNATGSKDSGLFALPFSREQADLVILPVPWEVTTSYGHGCSLGPQGIRAASKQLDLCDIQYGDFYKQGIYQETTDEEWLSRSKLLKEKALNIRDLLESGETLDAEATDDQVEINGASTELNDWVYSEAKKVLAENKWAAVLGGDHSSPLGLIRALKEKYKNLSILHIDAHMDLREAYQGYPYSHASIMHNVMREVSPASLVQLGIRDFCPQERDMAQADSRIHTFYDSVVSTLMAQGESWDGILDKAFQELSDEVYISFDIDGLQPDLCPNTGTPVPGGLSFQQAESLLFKLAASNKKIVGFDLCEVAPESHYDLEGWDTNVGARILFKLAGSLLFNQSK